MATPEHLRPKRDLKANIHMFGASLLAFTAMGTYAPTISYNVLATAIPFALSAASAGAFYKAIKAYRKNHKKRKIKADSQKTHDAKDDRTLSDDEYIALGMRDAIGRLYGTTKDGNPVFLPHKLKPAFEYILGGQGTGKTITQSLISCILTILRGDRSVYINDCKKELLVQVIDLYRKLGIEVLPINVGSGAQDTCPGVEVPPFEHAIDAFFSNDPDLHQMTTMFIREYSKIAIEKSPEEKVPFFTNNGRRAFIALLTYLLLFESDNVTPTRIWEIASDPILSIKCYERLYDYSGDLLNSVIRDGQKAAATLLQLHKDKPEYTSQFLSKLTEGGLQIYNTSGPLANFGRGAIARISDMRKRPMVVASMTPLAMLNDARAHTSFLAFNFYMSAKANPTGMRMQAILDEFTALNLPSWSDEMLVLRGLGVSAEMYVQSRIALEDNMGEKPARVVFEQSDVWQMSGLSFEDAKFASEVMGTTNVRRQSATMNGEDFENVGFSFQDHEEPLYTPQQLMALSKNEQVFKVRGYRPDILLKVPYWEIKGIDFAENPLEGPAPKVPPVMELKISKTGVKVKWWKKRQTPKDASSPQPKKQYLLRPTSFIWVGALLALGVLSGFKITKPDPYFFWSQSRLGCEYVSLTGKQIIKQSGNCPPVWIRQGGHPS